MLQEILSFFEQTPPVLGALYATLFTWGMTALGASFVFFFKNHESSIFGWDARLHWWRYGCC